MAQVTLTIAGREYDVGCRDGEEEHLRRLGQLLDTHAEEAKRAVGGVNEVRQMLLAGLLIADELVSGGGKPAEAPPAQAPAPLSGELATRLEALAERVETIATGLEGAAGSA